MTQDMGLADEPGRIAALHRLCVLDTCSEEQFDRITSLVKAVLDVPIAAVTLVDADRQWFKSIEGLDVSETPRSVSFCDHTIRSRAPMNIGDTFLDARFSDNPLVTGDPFIRAYLGAPLTMADGYNVGALCVIDRRPRAFSGEQEALLVKFAGLVVDELELRQLADRDQLTGAMTRRAFLDRLGNLRRNEDRKAVLVLFDLDHFKSINDRFGHPAGDEVLASVAGVCKARLQRGDAFGRIGGEEFGLLITNTCLIDAFSRVEAIRAAISRLGFAASTALTVTASFGMVELDDHSPASAVAMADAALYAAKRAGRNRTITTSEMLAAA